MTNYADFYGLVYDGEYLSNRGSSHGAENNLGWTVMPFSGSGYADPGCRFKFVSIDAEPADPNAGLPLLTTDTDNPVWYRIRNTRFFAKDKPSYALYRGDDKKLGLTEKAEDATQFYFTGTADKGVMTAKIHNNANSNLMAGEALWNADGCDWYIKTHVSDQGGIDTKTGKTYEGVLICDKPDFKVNWYVGSSDTSIKLYDYQWNGNIFTIEEVSIPTGIQELKNDAGNGTGAAIHSYKVLRDGRLVIVRGKQAYTVTGLSIRD